MNIQDLFMKWGIPVNKIEGGVGNISDGYHSFNDLYRQRCVLFAALCNTYPHLSWKSRKHADGELCFGGDWFVVGIDTPQGQYTYHYEDKDWDMFKVEELDVAKMWDGHTDKDVERLLSLPEACIKGYSSGEVICDEIVNEESTMSTWAKREIEIAKIKEKDISNDSCSWDYGCACYDIALKAFECLCGDGHSGMNIGFTKNILNKLLDGRPLTPIEDTPDIWECCVRGKDDPCKTYQCTRMSSLFKYVYQDGTVKYRDVESCYKIDINTGSTYHSSLVEKLINEIYPITMPYSPGKPIKVYCEDFLTDHANGDFDTIGIFHAIKSEETIQINRFFKDADTETGWLEIDKEEYDYRKDLAEKLKQEDKIKSTMQFSYDGDPLEIYQDI